MTPDLSWRGMRHADVPAVAGLGAAVYPSQLWEGAGAFQVRLQLGTGIVLTDPAGTLYGYLLAHPWDLTPPPLTAELRPVPQVETLWLHDVAVVPEARGRGLATLGVRRFLSWAGLFRSASLVALDPIAARYWRRFDFRPAADCGRVYTPGAVMMRRIS